MLVQLLPFDVRFLFSIFRAKFSSRKLSSFSKDKFQIHKQAFECPEVDEPLIFLQLI